MGIFRSLSSFFSRNIVSFEPVFEVLYVWMSIIIILIVLLLSFRCFTSPLKLINQKFKYIQRLAKELEGIKAAGGVLVTSKMRRSLKKIDAYCVKIDRFILMYRYDNPEHLEVKEIGTYTTRIANSVRATYSLQDITNEEKAIKLLIKNICKQSSEGIKYLRTLLE